MKKWLIGAGIAVVAIGLVLGGAAFAASRTSGTAARGAAAYSQVPFMSGRMGASQGSRMGALQGGRMGAFQPGGRGITEFGGQLHDDIFQAVAESLSLSVEEMEAKLADGQDLSAIALEQGVTEDELPTILDEARSSALAAAVVDGVLTQEQADWMSQHPAALRMLAGMRGGRGDSWSGGPMGWGDFGRR